MNRWLMVGVGALLVAGCASGRGAAPAVPAGAAGAGAAVLTATRFVDVAASAALYAIEAGRLAQARSRDPEVRALAALQVANGEGIGGQLSYAGRRVNALPDNEMTAQHRALLAALKSARDFDAAYLEQQQQMVPLMRRFHEDYAVRGGSATLRPVARFSAEKLAEQEALLERID
ncbi:DUF4142 domain-containing protein [Sphingomicrobium astaxanthinifaciens]|uniref:DUF4142 domain-containing protein n=1 Tax=Sphingomicrobium astaxanthinifaciens TaxID=1227949 RepID=UPI001FCA5E63|nr:DUF4142 domain-containing protein [Sphingomicrobium astaxanthinifaciens]MCJ7420960.1 DUF4142 domain-containing protein [Sphingomicrobium astaxanthinifaciens]